MKYLALTLLFAPTIALASIAGELVIGDRIIAYDSFYAELSLNSLGSFYRDDQLVATSHDSDGDGADDYWLVYENDIVTLEAHDTNTDGEPDALVEFDANGEVTETSNLPTEWQRPEVVEFADLVAETESGGSEVDSGAAATEDLVGHLDSIKIPGKGIPKLTIFLWLLIIGAGYWWYKNKYKK